MKTKADDVLYCGIFKEKLKSSNPVLNNENLGYLKNWIVARYNVHLKKDIMRLEKPWTEDEVLLNYRFCNVRREHDRESRWLIENVCNSNMVSYNNKLLNCILFRLINKSETIELFGVLDFDNLDYDLIWEALREFEKNNPGYIYFSSAFFTSGPKVVCNKFFGKKGNMVVKMIKLVEKYYQERILDRISESESQEAVYLALREFQGFGEFLAYQMFVDFSYIKEFPYSENEFTVAGPGCKKGLNLIFNDFDGLNYEEALFWLRDNQDEIFGFGFGSLFSDLDECNRCLNVMSLENCMCELSKYIRAIKGTGRPRVRYSGC
ncbi:MAG: putative DNA base hypermodification protein [Nanoarchaeota archaeon]|jgi:hypothetical protein|nr:putative DNA base hypermodification protein [Nanoarchaeota archaeon]